MGANQSTPQQQGGEAKLTFREKREARKAAKAAKKLAKSAAAAAATSEESTTNDVAAKLAEVSPSPAPSSPAPPAPAAPSRSASQDKLFFPRRVLEKERDRPDVECVQQLDPRMQIRRGRRQQAER